jgi:hypothetical protein
MLRWYQVRLDPGSERAPTCRSAFRVASEAALGCVAAQRAGRWQIQRDAVPAGP